MKDGHVVSTSGTGTFSSGTGRFTGIHGKGTCEGSPNGDGITAYQVEGESTLPK